LEYNSPKRVIKSLSIERKNMNKVKNIALGGVFDRFHKGHQESIRKAISLAEKVYILMFDKGDEESHPDKMSVLVMPIEERKQLILSFLERHDKRKITEVTFMPDEFGVKAIFKWNILWTIEDLTLLQAEDDKEIAGRLFGLIDEKRKEIGLPPTKVIWIKSVKGVSGQKLSSSDMRKGGSND
jgi:cytidyltransferase-like protein